MFAGGGRGCWVDLSANELLDDASALAAMRAPAAAAALGGCRAIHVGYPHLLANLQGDALRRLLDGAPALAVEPRLLQPDQRHVAAEEPLVLVVVLFGLLLGGGTWMWVLLGWAALIGYSRMYLGVHFPLDIAGGMLLGAFIGYVMWRIQNKLVGTPINLE